MKKQRILLPLYLTAFLLFTFAACSQIDEDTTDDNESTTVTTISTTASSTVQTTTDEGTVVPVDNTVEVIGNDLTLDEIAALDCKKQGYGPGVQCGDDKRPYGAISLQEKYEKYDAYFINEPDENVYLTFDEGYENGYTSQILDTLKEKGVKATFFVTLPYAKKNPELVQRMIDEGHVVGNHSCTHPSMPTVGLEQATEEIKGLHDYILENFDYTMSSFRPPMGEFSEQTLALTQNLGYKTVLWSFAYRDWETDNQMGYDAAYKKVKEAVHDGEIMLLHAVSKDNANILGDVIDYIQSEGYQVKPFS